MTSRFPDATVWVSRIYAFFIVAFFGIQTVLADTPAPLAGSPGFLWKVEGPQPSWLCGTIHSADTKVTTLPPAVLAALDGGRSFHPELELTPEIAASLALKLFQSPGPPLATRLPPALWQRVRQAGARIGLPDPVLLRLTPAYAALLFASPAGADPATMVDGLLYARAQDRGLAISALETVDEQLGAFGQLTESEAIAALAEALDEVDAGRPQQARLIAAYATGDERAVLAVIEAEFSKSPVSRALAEPLLYARNRVMTDRLLPALKEGGAFVAIGVAHLLGSKSVVELLRARGYKVTRVR